MKIDEKILDEYILLVLRLFFLMSYACVVLIIGKIIVDIMSN